MGTKDSKASFKPLKMCFLEDPAGRLPKCDFSST